MVKTKTNSVYLDTAIFIYYFEENLNYLKKTEALFEKITRDSTKIIVSPLILTELFVAPYKAKSGEIINQWLSFFKTSPQIKILDFTPQIALDAAFIRAKYGFKTPDSIHLATALNAGVDAFLSNDKQLSKFMEVKIVYPLQ